VKLNLHSAAARQAYPVTHNDIFHIYCQGCLH